jgi:diadenosine tetraphosphate (Ap4A) HIT family hydrolase
MKPTTQCEFCHELSGSGENSFDRIYRFQPRTRVISRSANFVVVPSLGQLSEGHLLLLPVGHWTALADLPKSLFDEFEALRADTCSILQKEYGPCLLFEHGVREGDSGGCGIYHAHGHAVPFPPELDPIARLMSAFPHQEIGKLSEIREKCADLSGYIFYQDSRSKSHVFAAPNLPSQYMRKLLAGVLGAPGWDWRTAGREERLLATLGRLSTHFDDKHTGVGTRETAHGNAG